MSKYLLLLVAALAPLGCSAEATGEVIEFLATLQRASRSTSIAITSDDRYVVTANRESDSVSVIEVRDAAGNDTGVKVAEVGVGKEPRYVAISPDDSRAYVSNAVSGTVSVVALTGPDAFREIAVIPVGAEPRGLALAPNGTRLFVANQTSGTVSVIATDALAVFDTVVVGGTPTAVAVTNDGDTDDDDEAVYVTQFYAERIPGGPGEGFDTAKQGVVFSFSSTGAGAPVKRTLAPVADAGFPADRTAFCAVNNPQLHDEIFCPDPLAPAGDPVVTENRQGAHPNQLFSILIRGTDVYVPSIAAAPEPPVRFNVNVQALVHVIDRTIGADRPDLTVNLNDQIKTETQPAVPNASLDRLFGGDIVAIDATAAGDQFLFVSRGGNYVLRAGLDGNRRIDIGAPGNVVRLQTGNIPTGVVMSHDGRRAYTNNEVGHSVTALDLETNATLARDIAASTPPQPGTFEHASLVGKLVFFTALGTPDNGLFGTPVRDIVPLADRGKASDNNWSSCASCHPDGLADGVTWFFPTGPRQTIPLDGFFAQGNPADQRISNWNAVRGSITDFNNNSRNIQGGIGFAGDPPAPGIFNHGLTEGVSEALDAMTLWVQTVRTPIQPPAPDAAAALRGRGVFAANCASCHGGAKWTKSQVLHNANPAFASNPLAGGLPLDPGITHAGPQIISYTLSGQTIRFLEDVGTFDGADPREIRGAGGGIGLTALGAPGFNVPSLLGTRFHAPYLHDGSAATLQDVMTVHTLAPGQTVADALAPQDVADLLAFLDTIDDSTLPLRSEADDFVEDVLD